MKRNINILVLAFEIVAIVVLHTIKLEKAHQHQNASQGISKIKAPATAVKHYQLLSLK